MSETERLKKVVEENESNSRFHNFAECLCESYQREALVKAVEDAWVAYYAAYDARDAAFAAYYAAYDAREAACSLLGVYDKENTCTPVNCGTSFCSCIECMVPDDKPCKTHPNAPHGFLRNASHNEGRYVCECEHWKEKNT